MGYPRSATRMSGQRSINLFENGLTRIAYRDKQAEFPRDDFAEQTARLEIIDHAGRKAGQFMSVFVHHRHTAHGKSVGQMRDRLAFGRRATKRRLLTASAHRGQDFGRNLRPR